MIEKNIIENPNNPENYLLYAQWLIEHSDLRGELINLHFDLIKSNEYLKKHKKALLGELSADKFSPHIEFEWYMGFVKKVTLNIQAKYKVKGQSGITVSYMLKEISTHPAFMFLQELALIQGSGFAKVLSNFNHLPCFRTLDLSHYDRGSYSLSTLDLSQLKLKDVLIIDNDLDALCQSINLIKDVKLTVIQDYITYCSTGIVWKKLNRIKSLVLKTGEGYRSDPMTLKGLHQAKQIKYLKICNIAGRKLTDNTFKEIAQLKRLKQLDLTGNYITEIPKILLSDKVTVLLDSYKPLISLSNKEKNQKYKESYHGFYFIVPRFTSFSMPIQQFKKIMETLGYKMGIVDQEQGYEYFSQSAITADIPYLNEFYQSFSELGLDIVWKVETIDIKEIVEEDFFFKKELYFKGDYNQLTYNNKHITLSEIAISWTHGDFKILGDIPIEFISMIYNHIKKLGSELN